MSRCDCKVEDEFKGKVSCARIPALEVSYEVGYEGVRFVSEFVRNCAI